VRVQAWFHRGMARLRLGQLEEAWGDLRQVLQLERGHAEAARALELLKT
jgi:hypothetical protein